MDAIPPDRRKTTVMTSDGVEIVLEEAGNPAGAEIVFIHGFSVSRLCWMKQLRGKLAHDFRMVAYDLRGHGESAKPSDPVLYREGHRWAAELAAVIDAAEMQKPVLVAWSYAGRIVADYLRHFGTGAIAGLNIIGAKTNSDPAFNAPLVAPHQQRNGVRRSRNQRAQHDRLRRSLRAAMGRSRLRAAGRRGDGRAALREGRLAGTAPRCG